jgi:hypothetical protein
MMSAVPQGHLPLDSLSLPAQNPVMANRKTNLPTGRQSSMKVDEMRSYIHSLRGSCKLNTSGKPFADWMADLNNEEKELEERKFQRLKSAR